MVKPHSLSRLKQLTYQAQERGRSQGRRATHSNSETSRSCAVPLVGSLKVAVSRLDRALRIEWCDEGVAHVHPVNAIVIKLFQHPSDKLPEDAFVAENRAQDWEYCRKFPPYLVHSIMMLKRLLWGHCESRPQPPRETVFAVRNGPRSFFDRDKCVSFVRRCPDGL